MMMMITWISVTLLCIANTEAFAPVPTTPLQRRHEALCASSDVHRGDDRLSIVERARQIAFGNDDILVLDAEVSLNQFLELERDCSSSDRVDDDVCEIVMDYSMEEVVSQLKAKSDLAESIRRKYVLNNLGGFILMGMSILASSLWMQSRDGLPFTVEELAWAIKGGYLESMLTHWLRNGGL